jgi:hypothetical protein
LEATLFFKSECVQELHSVALYVQILESFLRAASAYILPDTEILEKNSGELLTLIIADFNTEG